MKKLLLICITTILVKSMYCQVVNPEAYFTLKCSKFPVMDVAISPRGDLIAVGLAEYAEVYDLKKGKKVFSLKHESSKGIKTVNSVIFNKNGEYIATIDYKGRTKVWSAVNGKEESSIAPHRSWLPKPADIKTMGLQATNGEFNKYYTQLTAAHPKNKELVAKSVQNATINFENNQNGALEQELIVPETKDSMFNCPAYFNSFGDIFVTGNDQGVVYLHKVNPKGRF